MDMYELFSTEDLDKARSEKLINMRESGDGLFIYNYSDAAMYTPGAWDNPAVRTCRGLIVDESGWVKSRSFAKFFNYGQDGADHIDLNERVEVTDKADGSLGIFYLNSRGELSVATRGSFQSDQAIWATKWVTENSPISCWENGFTPLAEIIYPENRIVLSYDFEGLVLLGGVWNETGKYVGPDAAALIVGWNGRRTEVFPYRTLKEALEVPPRPNAEGLVVRAQQRIVKIKQEDYLKAHAYLTNCTPLQIWRKVREGYMLEDFLQEAPDEFIPLVTQYYTELVASMEGIRDRVNSEWDLLQQSLPEDHSRKQLAEAAKGNPHSPALFMLADGKDIEPYLLKKVKPSDLP